MRPRRPTKRSWSDAAQRGNALYVLFSLLALAALRARQGDDAAADGLYEEAIACSFNPWVSADAMVGQAAVARRLGDLARARALLDAAGSHYRKRAFPPASPWCSLAWRGGHSQRGQARRRRRFFAADASQAASASGDPATQLLADTAVAAVKALADPTRHNIEAFVALAQQRAVRSGTTSSHRRARCRRARGPPRARVALSVTSASPQASQANWDSCSQRQASPSATMITWTLRAGG